MTCAHGVSLMLPCPQCDADARAHEQRVSDEQQRAADRRIVEFHQAAYGPSVDDSWADEAEDVCWGCRQPHIWHGRTEADRYCFQCRYPERD